MRENERRGLKMSKGALVTATVAERQESPVVIRTRFQSQFVSIQDLQTQLYRDADRASDPLLKDYIREMIDRLEKLKR